MVIDSNPQSDIDALSTAALQDDSRWRAVELILISPQFVKSGRLSAFLRYVCVRALDGRVDEISEQLIGLHVFKRPADFNAGEDNIVRSTARQLRQRLALYYQEDGRNCDIRIEVPRGGYVPVFLENHQAATSSPAISEPVMEEPVHGLHSAQESRTEWQRKWWAFIPAIAFFLGVGATLALQHWPGFTRSSNSHPLWSLIFSPNRNTLLVPGDAGLNMYNNLARTQVSAGDYITGAYLRTPEAQTPAGYAWSPFAERRYTSIVDLSFADRLRSLPEFRADRYTIRFARDIHVTDFRNANIILTGAPTYNPWIELFDRNLNFHIVYNGSTNTMRVLNGSPRAGEKTEYNWSADDPSHRGYAYIALIDNLHGDGKVLLIEGTTMAGVDAADAFLMNDARMADLLKSAMTGSKLGNFEVLLEASVIDGSSPDAKMIAYRIGDNLR